MAEGIDILNGIVLNKANRPLDEVDLAALKCNHCQKLLRDPHQLLACGHRFCKNCLQIIITEKGSDWMCPVDQCGEEVSEEDVKPDRACLKELAKLKSRCRGCKWEGDLLELEDHLVQCPLVEVKCQFQCGRVMQRYKLAEHYKNCPFRRAPCKYCKREIPLNLMEDHYNDCELIPVKCSKCGIQLIRSQLSNHELEECPMIDVECNLEHCLFKGKRSTLPEHYKTHMVDLITLTNDSLKTISDLGRTRQVMQKSLSELEEKSLNYQKQIRLMQDNIEEMASQISESIKELQNQLANTKFTMSQSLGTTHREKQHYYSSSSEAHPLGKVSDEVHNIGSRIVKLEQEVMILKPNIDEVRQTTYGFNSQLVGSVETVQNIRETISRHAVAMDEVKLRQDILDVKTVNGAFIWKIPEVERRHREAQDRRTLSLYSPPFHTSPHGYRMCIRTYLNGDGSGKGFYISVFFVLMKSEHDDLLAWPFRRPVTFELVNQDNRAKGILETFMPDVVSPSFQKPTSEMNVASGFPKFAQQSVLKDPTFTKGDSIFIRCKIDTSGLQLE